MEVENINKVKSILAIVLVICFISGGYALYLSENGFDINSDVNQQSASPQSDVPNTNNPTNGAEKVVTLDDVKTAFENLNTYSDGYMNTYSADVLPTYTILVNPDFNSTGYHVFNSEYESFYIRDDLNTTDKYVQCAECGGNIPIGPVTKALPDNLICHGHDDSFGSNIDDDYCALTYDEVLYTANHDGFLPESAYTRINQHLGITTSYEEYISNYHSPASSVINTVENPIADNIELPVIPIEDNTNNADVSPQNDVVYGVVL